MESSHWSGKDLFLTPKRVFDSEERQSQNARSFFQKPPEEKNLSQKVRLAHRSRPHLLTDILRSFLASFDRRGSK